jgi:hypothetical protein
VEKAIFSNLPQQQKHKPRELKTKLNQVADMEMNISTQIYDTNMKMSQEKPLKVVD